MGARFWFGMAALQMNVTAVHIPLISFSLFYRHVEVSARQISLSSPLSSSLELLHVSHTNTLPGPDNELDLTHTIHTHHQSAMTHWLSEHGRQLICLNQFDFNKDVF